MRRSSLLVVIFLAVFCVGGSKPGNFPEPEKSLSPCGAQLGLGNGPSWSFIGPRSITDGQAWPGRVHVTGRVNSVTANPHNPFGEVWVATGGGGAWRFTRSPEQGLDAYQWEPMTNSAESPATGVVRLDSCTPERCRTVWVGTGENGIRRDTQYGAGVLRGRYDDNSGKYIWTQLGADLFRFGAIADLVLDPSTPDDDTKTLWVALSSGVTANAVHATVPTEPSAKYGVYKSTDAGQSWNLVLDLGRRATDLEIHPQDPSVLFAGIERLGFWRSTDGGANWQQIVNGIPGNYLSHAAWPEIAVHRESGALGAILYGVLDRAPGCPHPHAHKGSPPFNCSPGIFKSINGGNSWSLRKAAIDPPDGYAKPLTTYTSYLHDLTIHPSDPNTLWYGGTQLYRSTDGGSTWSAVGKSSLHPDHHGLFVWEDSGSLTGVSAYDVGDGGFFVGDGVGNWDDGFQHGLAVTQFQSISSSPLTTNVIGGTQDNGTNLYTGSVLWEHIDDGDAASTIIDADDFHRTFDVYVGVPPRRCLDNGNHCGMNWESIGNGLGTDEISAWYPPMIQDPSPLGGSPPQHPIFFGKNALFRTIDDGDSWSRISPLVGIGPDQPIYTPIDSTNVVTAIAVSPTHPNRIYLGFYSGLIQVTSNGRDASPVWTRIDQPTLPDRPITSIAIHPVKPNEVYVSFSGRGEHSVYMSEDTGATWHTHTETWGGSDVLATRPANRLAIEPEHPYRIWLGTDACVYSRPAGKGSGSWIYAGHGMPTAAVYDFDVDQAHQRVYAATHGRGVWSRPTTASPDPIVKKPYEELCCAFWVHMGDPAPFEDQAAYIPLFATALEPDASCRLTLFEGKRECGTSSVDAEGGRLRTDAMGALVSDKPGFYVGRPMAWACYDGRCAGGFEASDCRVTSAALSCGRSLAETRLVRAVGSLGPSSTSLRIRASTERTPGRPPAAPETVRVRPTLKLAGGASRPLCEVELTPDQLQAAEKLEREFARAINRSDRCAALGVEAMVVGEEADTSREDPLAPDPRLRLVAPRLTGVQLFTAVDASAGMVVAVDSMGLPLRGVGVAPRLTLDTVRGGAAGGELTVTEVTPLGRCTMSVRTNRGDTAEAIAVRLQRRFLMKPAPSRRLRIGDACHAHENARDVARRMASLQFPLAAGISVTTTDPGLSYLLDTE